MYLWLYLGMAVLVACATPEEQPPPVAAKAPAADALQGRIAAALDPANPAAELYGFHSSAQLTEFYRGRGFEPAWGADGGEGQRLHQLLTVIGGSGQEGLSPEDYHLRSLTALIRRLQNNPPGLTPQARARLDCLATDAFLTYAGHALYGRISPEAVFAAAQTARKEADLIQFLQAALDSGSVDSVLRSLMPQHTGYTGLRRELARYRAIAASSEWPLIPAGPILKVGARDHRVPILRRRLQLEGYGRTALGESGPDYDVSLQQAVADFQQRHGLARDGIVGPATRDALNTPVTGRVEQIQLNLERWRWLPRFLGHRYLFVNIADFQLEVVEEQKPVAFMRAIVGRDYRQTPIFSAMLKTIVFNPYWYVPQNIFFKDLLPKIQADPSYLTTRNYKIFSRMGPEAVAVDPSEIDWDGLTPVRFDYILRNESGPGNPLGRVKFILPNPFDVYIHDTPSPVKFRRNRRDFSSGCIRIEDPIALSIYLLQNQPPWSRENILEAVESGRPVPISLSDPVPVHIVYMTAWTDTRGGLHFRPDIYDRDAKMTRKLFPSPDRRRSGNH
jgi:murein L,D-transpeptidase YcbB/YkuD